MYRLKMPRKKKLIQNENVNVGIKNNENRNTIDTEILQIKLKLTINPSPCCVVSQTSRNDAVARWCNVKKDRHRFSSVEPTRHSVPLPALSNDARGGEKTSATMELEVEQPRNC